MAISAFACSKAERTATRAPETPAPTIVYVIVTPTAAPAVPDYRATISAAAQPLETTVAPPTVRPSSLVPPAAPPSPSSERLYLVVEDFLVRPPDSIGAVWFDGEVKNLGARPAKVKVLVKAYSINGVLLDSKSFYPDPHAVGPGERSHFNHYVKSSTGQPIYRVDPEAIPD